MTDDTTNAHGGAEAEALVWRSFDHSDEGLKAAEKALAGMDPMAPVSAGTAHSLVLALQSARRARITAQEALAAARARPSVEAPAAVVVEALGDPSRNLGWFSGLARKCGFHTQADWLDEHRGDLVLSTTPPAGAGADAEAPGVAADLRRRAQACRDLLADATSPRDRYRLNGKSAAYDHAAELVLASTPDTGEAS